MTERIEGVGYIEKLEERSRSRKDRVMSAFESFEEEGEDAVTSDELAERDAELRNPGIDNPTWYAMNKRDLIMALKGLHLAGQLHITKTFVLTDDGDVIYSNEDLIVHRPDTIIIP